MTTAPTLAERRMAPRHLAFVVLGGVVAALGGAALWVLIGLGIGLLVLFVGLFVIVAALGLSSRLTRFHRARARALLDVEIPPTRSNGDDGWRGWVRSLGDGPTWRQLIYHAIVAPVVLPVGAVLVAAAWGGGVALLTAPLIGLFSSNGRDAPSLPSPPGGLALPEPTTIASGGWLVDNPIGWVAAVLAGLVILWLAPHLTRGLAALDLAIARPMLGPTRGEELSPRVSTLEETRAGVIDAADAERRRIERDLHDGAQQRLTSLALNLGMARSTLAPDAPPETRRAIEEAHDEAKLAIAELRSFVRGLHPAVLDERGLDAALSGIVARSPVPTSLHVVLAERPSRTVEAIAYFVVSEALTNIAKHAHASKASVRVLGDGRHLTIEVTDDGQGGAATSAGSGLTGLAGRVGSVDGRLDVMSPVGGPTVLRAELPCAS